MKKNGFIATSILYTFFLVFITLFVALITNYIHNQVLISAIDDASWSMLKGVGNVKLSDLQAGDRVVLQSIKYGKAKDLLNDANWVVAYTKETSNQVTLYLISNIEVQNSIFKYQVTGERIEKKHSITLNVFEDLLANGYYTEAIKYNENKAANKKFEISLPKLSVLKNVRALTKDNFKNKSAEEVEIIKTAVFNASADYLVYSDIGEAGYDIDAYYNMKIYNFEAAKSAKINLSTIIPKYCSGTLDANGNPSYTNNPVGFMHTEKDLQNKLYVDYCVYANPYNYSHTTNELLVIKDEINVNDRIASRVLKPGEPTGPKALAGYNFRLMATITVDKNATDTYFAGGKGSATDPYLLIDGRRQS